MIVSVGRTIDLPEMTGASLLFEPKKKLRKGKAAVSVWMGLFRKMARLSLRGCFGAEFSVGTVTSANARTRITAAALKDLGIVASLKIRSATPWGFGARSVEDSGLPLSPHSFIQGVDNKIFITIKIVKPLLNL